MSAADYPFVDCQGFAGGMTLGFVQAGLQLVGKREHAAGFGVPNCEVNRHLLGPLSQWRAECAAEPEWTVPAGGARVVMGNPPCSAFAAPNQNKKVPNWSRLTGVHADVNACMYDLMRYSARVRPEIVVMESVQGAYRRGRELLGALRAELESQSGQAYDLYHVLHNALSVGGVAMRPRYFLVLSRVPFGIERPEQERTPVLWDAIGDLTDLPQSWVRQPATGDFSAYARANGYPAADGTVDGHLTAAVTFRTQRILDVLEGIDWQPGEYQRRVLPRYVERHGALPPSWHVQGHAAQYAARNYDIGFDQPIRWDAAKPARVITGVGLLKAIHPVHNRFFTHREVARVMGFPDDWRLAELRPRSIEATHGKGITVQCGRWIGTWVRTALDGYPGTYRGELVGEREWLIDVTHDWKANKPAQ